MDFLYSALLILAVIALFNIMIFVHELGHFLAARWRGLQVDRFQVWFGKPIWKKTINGVQYGLGWLPFGGFVALPQMVTMESVEGSNLSEDALPPVKPIDKIIVAFAGPLFSLLLAVVAAFGVWKIGQPLDAQKSNVVGAVAEGMPGEGVLQAGDKILEVDGYPVRWFAGRLFDDIRTRIMLTEGETIDFKIDRDGEIMNVQTKFDIADRKLWQRRALPQVGIAPSTPAVIGEYVPSTNKGPAQLAGLQPGDEVIAVNGETIYSQMHVNQSIKKQGEKASTLTVKRGDQTLDITVTPLVPTDDYYKSPMIGIKWDSKYHHTTEIIHPTPWEQVRDSLRTMGLTIKTISSPKSNVGIDQLAGPVGIAKTKFRLLLEEDGWLRVLAFFVLFNVNLAVLNMMPFPVLDGGHIVMASYEWIRGKPLPQRFLEVVQGGFALVLIGFMLFITTKDIGDDIPGKQKERAKPPEKVTWPS